MRTERNSARAGILLAELAGYLVVTVSLLGTAGVLLGGMLRAQSAYGEGLRCDLACERLRRDLAAGGALDGDGLRIGSVRWTVQDGRLVRGAIPLLAVRSATWKPSADGWVVTITPEHGAARTIRTAGAAP
jgi:hypothetical protein